ncbi:MAG: hypothetical protein JWO47_836 [Candidatus Saccharibacteria bacterium]|nr:hypothetical protein [Candidatus Saccharibacteria bacterium]
MSHTHEALRSPVVETLVEAAIPESRVYTVDGITLPDFDLDLGVLSLFKDTPTDILDELFQDAYPENKKDALNSVSEQELTNLAGFANESISADHIKKAQPNQTVYIGPRAIHRRPALKAGAMRLGIFCFIGVSELNDI